MADSARSKRQEELEKKKKRLEELKARRQQRTTTNVTAEDAARAKIAASANLDDYIEGLLKAPTAAPSVPVSNDVSAASVETTDNGSKASGVSDQAEKSDTASQEETTAPVAASPQASFQPKAETFEMGTQTADDEFPASDEDQEGEDLQQQSPEDAVQDSNLVETTKQATAEEEIVEEAKVLTAEEVEKELSSEAFSSFLNSTSKKVERVLGSDLLADLLVDYDGDADGAKRASTKVSDGSKFLSSRHIYECPKWTATRDITDMDWSPLHRELMLCGYHMPTTSSSLGQPVGSSAVKVLSPDDTPSDSLAPRSGELLSDGLALVWNLAMPNRPEHIFTCGSPVTTTRFHPTESALVIGGCQSGQVVVWDVRAGRMPVQKSILTTTASGNSKGHTHPICAMEVTEGGAGLVTGATDGRVNFWSLSNLRDPAESLQIGDSLSCLAVSPESETLICGDDVGSIYAIQSSNSSIGGGGQRSRRQVRKLDGGTECHYGMVTSLATKTLKAAARAGLSKGFLRGSGGLFLSSGVDWTIKMWAPAYTDKPLLSLMSHSYDYMSDVQWSPAHPSLMATASSNGTVGLWNFALSVEEPITGSDGIVVEPDGGSGRGLNKLKWSSDGRRMLAASADRVHVLVLAEDVVRQKGDEDTKMMNHLTSRGLLDRE